MPKSDGTLGRNKDFLIFFDKEKMGIYNMQYETHRNTKKRILEKSGHQYPLRSDDSGNGRFVFGLSFDVVLCNRITFRIQKLDDISHLGRRRHALFRFGACPNPRLQKILRFLQQKMGWEFPDKPKKEEKTTVDDGKKSFKDYFTLSNISLAIIALGAVFTIISAALGCINRDTWVDATSSFMKESGYMTEPMHIQNFKDVIQAQNAGDKNISTINIDFKDKQAVIIYVGTESPDKLGFVTYDYYIKYENQIVKTRTKDGVITLTETPAPKLDDTAIKKIFFFMFKDFDVEKQVLIYLPEDTREGAPNEIKIIGDNVIYAKQVDKTDKAE